LSDLTHTGTGVDTACFPLGIGLLASYAIHTYGKSVNICNKFKKKGLDI